MHRIGSKIQFTRPSYGAVIECNLRKYSRVRQCSEYPSPRRMHQAGHIDQSREAIGKYNSQPKVLKSFHFGHAPWRPGRNLLP